MRARALAAAALLAGCGYTDEGPVVYDPALVSALLVEAHLAEDAARVMDFRPAYSSVPGDGYLLGEGVELVHGAAAGGTRLVHLVLSTSRDRTIGNRNYEGWFTIGPEGQVARLARPAEAPPLTYDPRRPEMRRWVAAVDGPATPLIVECTPEHATVYDLHDETLRARAGGRSLCAFSPTGPGLGPSTLPDRVVRQADGDAVFRLEALAVPSGAVVATRALPHPVENPVTLWIEERAEGRFRVLARDRANSRLYLVEGDGEPQSAALGGFPVLSATHTGEHVRVTGTDGRVAIWDPTRGDALIPLPAAEVPDGFDDAPWRFAGTAGAAFRLATGINVYTELVSVPLAAYAQVPAGHALRAGPAASTPCVERDECRLYGESYLLAVFDAAPEPLALYAFWSWTYELALYVAPAFRPEALE